MVFNYCYCCRTESQFVEWCIIIGNDYTEGYSRGLFKGFDNNIEINEDENDEDDNNNNNINTITVKFTNKHSAEYLNQLRELIILQNNDFKLFSDHVDLQLIINFSRDLYSLNDLINYKKDEDVDEGIIIYFIYF